MGLCRRCARRGWLLSRLGDPLDELAADPARLWPTLELEDRELIAALTDEEAKCSELLGLWESWPLNRVPVQMPVHEGGGYGFSQAACRHHCRYPVRLRDDPLAPHALAECDRPTGLGWEELRERKIVAIVGAHTPSRYGVDVARAFATELAAAGVTVAGSGSGIGTAARTACVEAGGQTLCVGFSAADSEGGSEPTTERRERRLVEPIAGAQARRWPAIAAERTLALIADLVLVAQAHEQAPFDLACAEVARSRGVPVAAVPGPIDSPASRGSNQLLMSGMGLVCSTGEVLDALFGVSANVSAANVAASADPASNCRRDRAGQGLASSPRQSGERCSDARAVVDDEQRAVLDLLALGERTLGELAQELADNGRAAVAAAELELSGLVVRGNDGRYRPRHLR